MVLNLALELECVSTMQDNPDDGGFRGRGDEVPAGQDCSPGHDMRRRGAHPRADLTALLPAHSTSHNAGSATFCNHVVITMIVTETYGDGRIPLSYPKSVSRAMSSMLCRPYCLNFLHRATANSVAFYKFSLLSLCSITLHYATKKVLNIKHTFCRIIA